MTSLGLSTFTDMVSLVGRLVNDPSTGRQTQIKDAINAAYHWAATNRQWDQLLAADETGRRALGDSNLKTLEASESEAPMPWGATRLKSLFYQDSHQRPIELIETAELYERAGGDLSVTGRPLYAAVIGKTAQYARLPASEAMKFDSDVSNANEVVRVEYTGSTGHVGRAGTFEDLTTGDWTSMVTSSGSQLAGWPITRISIPSTFEGDFRAYRNNGTTKLVEIKADEIPNTNPSSTYVIADRMLLRFWPVPDADYGLTVVYYRLPRRLTEDEDQPEVPVADFLAYRAAAAISRIKGDHQSAQQFDAEAMAAWSGSATEGTPRGNVTVRPARGGLLGGAGVSNWKP
jgi:hypothetical protein